MSELYFPSEAFRLKYVAKFILILRDADDSLNVNKGFK